MAGAGRYHRSHDWRAAGELAVRRTMLYIVFLLYISKSHHLMYNKDLKITSRSRLWLVGGLLATTE